jgi:copper chaperone
MASEVKEVLNVYGMSCMHCVHAVKTALSALNGVGDVDVDLNSKKVSVVYNQERVNIKQIKDAIEDAGYEVK